MCEATYLLVIAMQFPSQNPSSHYVPFSLPFHNIIPTNEGIEELLGMGSQAVNEYVELDWLNEPMCRSLPEQLIEVI